MNVENVIAKEEGNLKTSHLKIKDLPESERPYEKLLNHGAEVLSDAELLAVVIKSGTPKLQSVEVAQRILKLNRYEKGLPGLYNLAIDEFRQVDGIGQIKAIQIKAILELSKRLAKQQAIKEFQVTSPSSLAKIYMEEMRYLRQEHFKSVYLDTKNNILGDKNITIGTINSTIVHPREVFSDAVKCSAASIIVLHNHPSGDPSPSEEDIQVTKRLLEAGKILGIDLLDHIVIGDGKYISLKEKGFI